MIPRKTPPWTIAPRSEHVPTRFDLSSSHRPGFFTVDILGGLFLMAIAGTMLAVIGGRFMRASTQLRETREATMAAETTLSSLQAGRLAPASDVQVQIEPCKEGALFAGYQWIRVTGTVGEQTREVIGLVPNGKPATAPARGLP